jgi:hypothetical protein
MSSKSKKHIIDSLLREIYGDKSPPDQAPQILNRLEENDLSLLSDSKLGKLQSDSGPYRAIQHQSPPASETTRSHWLIIAASLAFCIGLIGATIKVMQNDGKPNSVAGLETADGEATLNDLNSKSLPANHQFKSKTTAVPSAEKLADSNSQTTTPSERKEFNPVTNDLQPNNPLPTFAQNTIRAGLIDIRSNIDQSFANLWHINVIAAPQPIGKTAWINRAFEKLLGRQPESSELDQLKTDFPGNAFPAIEDRIKIVESLISGDTLTREFSNYWADRFLGYATRNTVTLRTKSPKTREVVSQERLALQSFLRRSFFEKKPLNQIAHQLLTASGSVDPKAIEYNPAAGFLAGAGKSANEIAETVSRSFLGTELACAQCHSDPAFEQSQQDYLGLATFFLGTQVSRKITGVAVVSEKTITRKRTGLFFTDKNGAAVYAPPLVAGHDVDLNPADPRKSLADQLIQSDRFANAMVNWVWEEIYGYGLSKTGRINQTVNAPHYRLMSDLAEQLVAHDFDFRAVAKWAVLSEAFVASNSPPAETLTKDIPKYGGVAFFSYFYDQIEYDPVESVNRLVKAYEKPEGITDTARLSLNVKQTAKGIEIIDRLEQGVLPNGLKVEDEIPDFARGWGSESRINSLLNDIAHSATLKLDQKLEHLYLLSLKRPPSRSELAQLKSLFTIKKSGRPQSDLQVLQDIWWAIYPR